MHSTEITLGDILMDAIYNPTGRNRLKLHTWGSARETDSNQTRAEASVGLRIGKYVNAHYAGRGNNFFWHTINDILEIVYAHKTHS